MRDNRSFIVAIKSRCNESGPYERCRAAFNSSKTKHADSPTKEGNLKCLELSMALVKGTPCLQIQRFDFTAIHVDPFTVRARFITTMLASFEETMGCTLSTGPRSRRRDQGVYQHDPTLQSISITVRLRPGREQ